MPTNFYMIFVAALIPFVLGALWYGPIFGKQWMKVNGFTEEYLKEGNMAVILGVSYLFTVFFCFAMSDYAIHQSSIYGLLIPDVQEAGSQVHTDAVAFFEKYGNRHRTFSHGAAHGFFFALCFALPLIAVNSLFERRGWKYIMIHWGYWLISSIIVGGLLCATLTFPPV